MVKYPGSPVCTLFIWVNGEQKAVSTGPFTTFTHHVYFLSKIPSCSAGSSATRGFAGSYTWELKVNYDTENRLELRGTRTMLFNELFSASLQQHPMTIGSRILVFLYIKHFSMVFLELANTCLLHPINYYLVFGNALLSHIPLTSENQDWPIAYA